MISVQSARDLIMEKVQLMPVEVIPLTLATEYVLAEDVYALTAVPSFDNAAMDGYALYFEEGRSTYTVTDKIQAGSQFHNVLEKGKAARIFTGAMIPEGADTVIQQELASLSGNTVEFNLQGVKRGNNIRIKGS